MDVSVVSNLKFSYLEQMQDEVRKTFPVLVSRPNWIMTWLIRIFGGAFLLFLLAMLSVFPLLFTERSVVFIVGATIYYLVWGTALYFIIRHIKKNAGNRIKRIVVDDQGIHYENKNGTTDSVLYSQIRNLSLPDSYEVYLSYQNKTQLLTVWLNDGSRQIYFDNLDPGLSYYPANSRALRAGFVQRIRYFRPDLKIHPRVYEEFCIHPETFQFDQHAFRRFIITSAVIILGLLAVSGLFLLIILYFSDQL